jgi:ssDNA-binding Zn-finger/Zn-ribbon topoisomerase 1
MTIVFPADFNAAPGVAVKDVHCDACGSHMVIRKNRANGSLFLSCSKYPECQGTKSFTVESKDQGVLNFPAAEADNQGANV